MSRMASITGPFYLWARLLYRENHGERVPLVYRFGVSRYLRTSSRRRVALGVGAGRSGALPHKGENDVDGGSRNLYEFTQFLDGAKQGVDLHRPAALEVLEHRRPVGSYRSRSVKASFEPYPKSNVQFFSDTLRLGHHVPC